MDIKRIVRHLMMTRWQVSRVFPQEALDAIERAVEASEAEHTGEIRFAIEGALDTRPLLQGQTARERAIEVFSQQRLWDTEGNNGVLIYLLLADRDVEIVADRTVHSKVGSAEWESICHSMEAAFKQSDFERGVVEGIQAVSRRLIAHFPASDHNANELPDEPVFV